MNGLQRGIQDTHNNGKVAQDQYHGAYTYFVEQLNLRCHHEGLNQCPVSKDVFLEESYSVDQIFSWYFLEFIT